MPINNGDRAIDPLAGVSGMDVYNDVEQKIGATKKPQTATGVIQVNLDRLHKLRASFIDLTRTANHKANMLLGSNEPRYGEDEYKEDCVMEEKSPLVECSEVIEQLEHIAVHLSKAIQRF